MYCCVCYRNVTVYFTALLVSHVIEAGPNVFQSLWIPNVVSRAIVKPVYWFGIPNSDPQNLRSVKIYSSKSRLLTVHALVPQCALSVWSYSECKISKVFRDFFPILHWVGLTVPLPPSTPPQTPQLHSGFPTSVVGRTTGTRNLIAFNKALVTL